MHTTPRALGVALLLTALTPWASPAATAETGFGASDSEGDVWVELYDNEDTLSGFDAAGSPSNADVVAVQAVHARPRISFVTEYADLDEGPGESTLVWKMRMRFEDGPPVSANVYTLGRPDGQVYLWNERKQHAVQCDALRHTIDYDANTVAVSLPRSCVGKPRWFRFTGVSYAVAGSSTQTGDDDFNYLDNVLNDSHRVRNGNRNSSPRIHVG